MAMTREQRNERRSDLRAQTLNARYRDRLSQIMELWIRAKAEKWTHDAVLKYRSEWIYNDAYKLLPSWIHERMTGADDMCYHRTFREDLVFCYPHPLTGVITPANIICNEGLAQKLSEMGLDKQGHHYWKNDDGTFTHPFT